jgi:NAD(P)-dependent dehydrogenase (short-subunit alcohol dehydrogenase family)
MTDFTGKVAIVTGSTSGIGRETALHLAANGASVTVCGRRKAEGDEVVAAIEAAGGKALALETDVADPAQVEALIVQTVAKFGRLDHLVGNAAIEQAVVPIDQMAVADMDRIIAIDFKGMWHLAHFGLKHLSKPGGSIVFVSSFWSTLGGAGLSAYTAAKGAINAMTRGLAVEQGPHGVRVNCVVSGGVDTPQYRRFTKGKDMSGYMRANVPLGRVGEPPELARAIAWLLSSDASYVTGQLLGVDGGAAIKMSVAEG